MPLSAFVRCFALLAIALCGAPAAAAGPEASTVWIEVSRPSGVRFKGYRLPETVQGMGVVTRARQIATAAHVVWGATSITLTDVNGARFTARMQHVNAEADVALLRVDRPLGDIATARERPAALGERVLAVGLRHERGGAGLARGTIGATRWTSHGVSVPLIFTGIRGEHGMSGGGVFDERGALLGIVVRIERSLGYLMALPVAQLDTLATM